MKSLALIATTILFPFLLAHAGDSSQDTFDPQVAKCFSSVLLDAMPIPPGPNVDVPVEYVYLEKIAGDPNRLLHQAIISYCKKGK